MTGRQRLGVAIVFVIAVAGGGAIALAVLGGGGSPEPSSIAAASFTPAATGQPVSAPPSQDIPPTPASTTPASAAPSPTPTAAPAATPAPTATAAPTAPPMPTPTPTVAPGPPATIVVTQLRLDAADDPAGRNRLITFTTGGAGTVTVALTSLSPMGSTRMCLRADGKVPACRTTAADTLTATTTKKAAAFELTLRGDGIATPTVEVTITFPAAKPSVTIANTRFDGTAFADTNGIAVIVRPRAAGAVHVTASWGGHPFLWELDLFEQGGPGSQTLANQGPSTHMDRTLPVSATNAWKVLLQNIEAGFGTTPLTATIAWP